MAVYLSSQHTNRINDGGTLLDRGKLAMTKTLFDGPLCHDYAYQALGYTLQILKLVKYVPKLQVPANAD
jgi:hypothetical protein